MENNLCHQVFGNLYDNKVILRRGSSFLCEFISCTFEDGLLTVKLKVLEPIIRLKERYKILYNEMKSMEYLQLRYNLNRMKIVGMEKQQIQSLYGCRIWANYDLIRMIVFFHEEGLEREIINAL